MKAHQRIIREQHALVLPHPVPESLRDARVEDIDYKTAKKVIEQYEWLGTMGSTRYRFGLYFGDELAGVVCFGSTAGTKTAESVCGSEYAHMVTTLCRGACVHWAHPHSASFLISRACRLMSDKGFHIFVAYSDAAAGEVGTVYQASNWLHCEPTTQGSSMFVWPGEKGEGFKDGRLRDERCISAATRVRTSEKGAYRVRSSRRVLRERMVEDGFLFLTGTPKRRYVTFCADRRLERELRSALRWKVLPYPRRA